MPSDFATALAIIAGVMAAGFSLLAIHVYRRRRAARRELPEEAPLALPKEELDLTMVVPYFNPGQHLRDNIERIVEILRRTGLSFEVIAVSDGSTDGSERALIGQLPDVLYSVALSQNSGKGAALRVGMSMGRGRYVGFIDADGDVAPETLENFVALMRLYQPDIIYGSKRHPMSKVHYPPIRRVYSWGYHRLVRLLFRLKVRDTQTGLKLVRREVIAAVLPRMLEKRFAFDLELFVVARMMGHDELFEAPIAIDFQFRSTISLKAVRGMFLDTLAIFYRRYLVRYYDSPHRTVTPPEVIDAGD